MIPQHLEEELHTLTNDSFRKNEIVYACWDQKEFWQIDMASLETVYEIIEDEKCTLYIAFPNGKMLETTSQCIRQPASETL